MEIATAEDWYVSARLDDDCRLRTLRKLHRCDNLVLRVFAARYPRKIGPRGADGDERGNHGQYADDCQLSPLNLQHSQDGAGTDHGQRQDMDSTNRVAKTRHVHASHQE